MTRLKVLGTAAMVAGLLGSAAVAQADGRNFAERVGDALQGARAGIWSHYIDDINSAAPNSVSAIAHPAVPPVVSAIIHPALPPVVSAPTAVAEPREAPGGSTVPVGALLSGLATGVMQYQDVKNQLTTNRAPKGIAHAAGVLQGLAATLGVIEDARRPQ